MEWFSTSSLHSLSRGSFNSFTTSHHGSANGRPSLEGYPRRCSPRDLYLANRVATCLGMNSWHFSLQQRDSVMCTMPFRWRQHCVTRYNGVARAPLEFANAHKFCSRSNYGRAYLSDFVTTNFGTRAPRARAPWSKILATPLRLTVHRMAKNVHIVRRQQTNKYKYMSAMMCR